jgi:LysR family glycine cleavage system transcriptional activator
LAAENNSCAGNRHLPPQPALRAFEAAARRLSFREAAVELSLTPSAISHQVKSLEVRLGISLFVRQSQGLSLTKAGREYLRDLTPILDALDASTRRISAKGPASALRILSTPGFAARWLVPRLHRYPEKESIVISVSAGAPCMNFSVNEADVVIHWGSEPVATTIVEPMMRSGRYPVASPAFVERERLRSPADLLRTTLLHDEVDDGWAAWFSEAGVEPTGLPRGPRLAHCELSLTAAEEQQGVALAYDAMARNTIAEGRLQRLFDIESPSTAVYSFAYTEGRRKCPDIGGFRNWIFEEVHSEGLLDVQSLPSAAE